MWNRFTPVRSTSLSRTLESCTPSQDRRPAARAGRRPPGPPPRGNAAQLCHALARSISGSCHGVFSGLWEWPRRVLPWSSTPAEAPADGFPDQDREGRADVAVDGVVPGQVYRPDLNDECEE